MQLDEHIDFQDDIKNLESLFLKIEEKLKDQNLISSLRALNKKTLNSFNAFEKKAIKNLKFKKENDIAKYTNNATMTNMKFIKTNHVRRFHGKGSSNSKSAYFLT